MKDCINLKEGKFLAVSIYFYTLGNNYILGIHSYTQCFYINTSRRFSLLQLFH